MGPSGVKIYSIFANPAWLTYFLVAKKHMEEGFWKETEFTSCLGHLLSLITLLGPLFGIPHFFISIPGFDLCIIF